SDFYGGARMISFAPRLIVDHRFGFSGFRIAGSVGALVRETTEFLNVVADSEFTAGLALSYHFGNFRGLVELLADTQLAVGLEETDSEEIAWETLAGIKLHVDPEWDIIFGIGAGHLEGYGSPTVRALFGVRWEPSPNDPDGDGYPNDGAGDD